MPVRADPDLRPIATAFNETARSLQARVERDVRFASDVSHELRSPVTTMATAMEVLRRRREEMSPSARSAVDLLDADLGRFRRLVDDLLDVSRIMQGKVDLRKSPIRLAAVLEQAVGAMRPWFEGQEQEFSAKFPQEDLWLDADPVRLAQVVENLLRNACKYTDRQGRIELVAQREGDEAMAQDERHDAARRAAAAAHEDHQVRRRGAHPDRGAFRRRHLLRRLDPGMRRRFAGLRIGALAFFADGPARPQKRCGGIRRALENSDAAADLADGVIALGARERIRRIAVAGIAGAIGPGRRLFAGAALFGLVAATSGCVVGPDYTPPDTGRLPPAWEGAAAAADWSGAAGTGSTARGAGTSLAGQCCNAAIVVDTSKYCNRIESLDAGAGSAVCEPGVVLDQLRDAAEEYGLTFGPDPSTHNHNTLGGMLGNNACGVHAVMSGRASENVEEMDVLTYDGVAGGFPLRDAPCRGRRRAGRGRY